jgi:hypothetical protein
VFFYFLSKLPIVAIILTGLGVTLLDFSADSCDSILRAYLLDVCNPTDQSTGLNIHAFLGGAGACLGYIIAAIDWNFEFIQIGATLKRMLSLLN